MNKPGHVRLFVTRIMQEFESDAFFPEIDFEKYKLLPEYSESHCGWSEWAGREQ